MCTLSLQDKVAIINCMKELDSCSRCILRFLKERNSTESFRNPEAYLKKILQESKDIEVDLPLKRVKKNPCRTCLDILHDSTLIKFAECIQFTDINEYHYPDYITNISFPKCISVRNHSMYVYLKESFPHIYTDWNEIYQLNKVFKISSNEIISKTISKVFNPNSNFIVLFEIGYEDDDLEIENIKQFNHLISKSKQEPSRNSIVEILNKCEDSFFRKHFTVPPQTPVRETVVKVQCMAESICIGGRYLKFSRDMGQTPWIINNKVMVQYNLQDILFDSVETVLGYNRNNLKFTASGREDADVRMVGNGRPFYIQIDNPKDGYITFEQCREIEKKIFELKMAAVVKLQTVSKDCLNRIKQGEEKKRKHYHALCKITGSDIARTIDIINSYKNKVLGISQKTPLRVLHRRTQAIRKKCIYSMEATTVAGHTDLIEIKLITQAGTYVKEFINGDFRRTEPSLSSILDCPIDIVALDVTNIELSWPEE